MNSLTFVRTGIVLLAMNTLFISSCTKLDMTLSPASMNEQKGLVNLPGYTACDALISDGYVGKVSYFSNDSIDFYINASSRVLNARLNVYTASGVIADYLYLDSIIPQKITTANPYQDGYGYKYRIRKKLSSGLKSGVYTISKKIPFILKNPQPSNQVLVVYPLNTANAYNKNGGKSLYTVPRAYTVSYQRPTPILKFCNEFIKWNGTSYAFDYITDIELDDYATMQNYKMIVIIGHSEYWTRQARLNIDRFVNAGHHVLILSGNTMWWQVRYSSDKTKMICYKDAALDPVTDPLLETIKWTSSTLQFPIIPSIGADFQHGGYGMKTDSGWNGYKILIPNSPLLAGTGLKFHDILSCPTQEADGSYVIRNGSADPLLDKAKLNFYKAEMLGYDYGAVSATTIPTFIVFKKTSTSGVIINVGSTNWCNSYGFAGTNAPLIKMITTNSINLMMTNGNMFSY